MQGSPGRISTLSSDLEYVLLVQTDALPPVAMTTTAPPVPGSDADVAPPVPTPPVLETTDDPPVSGIMLALPVAGEPPGSVTRLDPPLFHCGEPPVANKTLEPPLLDPSGEPPESDETLDPPFGVLTPPTPSSDPDPPLLSTEGFPEELAAALPVWPGPVLI